MWTNVFRVGGFQQVSWFQFLPSEFDGGTLHDRSVNIEDQSDTSTSVVLSAHVKLQNEGYLSTWTNSFVGPWDPSQGIHNPDEKIKLWLFLPGRVSSITTNAQTAVQGLKVVASGFWRCPGDSEEIGIAFSQALRNRIDRAFRGLSYVRFGDVFVKYRSFGQADVHFRRPLFTCEFIFSVSEEALFIHVTVSSKRVRLLSCDDIEGVLRKQSQNAKDFPSVIVAPHGMRGKLTGCCPTDLASQLYQSKLKSPNGSVLASLPSHLTYTSNGNIRGKAYYAEVSLGCLAGRPGIWEQSSTENIRVKPETNDNGSARSQATNEKNASQEGYVQLIERTFIYPPEAVLVPLIPLLPARTCLKRCWLRDMAGTTWLESVSQTDMALTKFSMTKPILGNTLSKDSLPGSNSLLRQNSGISDSSSSSTTSSRGSASSTDTDTEQGVNAGEIDADGDSVISKHSQLTSPRDAGNPNSILAGKRGHSNGAESVSEAVTSKKACTVENTVQDMSGVSPELYANDTGKSGCTLKESSMAGGPSIASIFNKESWDWADGDQAIGIEDLGEFDDFGDFFEDDPLSFGEPPGSAESHGFIFNTANIGDGMAGLDTRGMDVGEQLLSPVFDFQSLDGFGEQPETTKTDIASNTEGYKDSKSSQAVSQISGESAIEVDSLPKSEAIYMFAPEYTPIQMPKNEFSSSLFKRPYVPKSRRLQNRESHSKIYHYSATPPPSPRRNVSGYSRKTRDEIRASNDSDIHTELKKLYTHALSAKKFSDNSCSGHSYSSVTQRRDSSFPGSFSVKIASSTQSKRAEGGLGNGGFLKFPRTVLATEIECAMFQAAMCRIRHMLLTSNNVIVFGSNKLNVDLLPCQLPDTPCHETNMTLAEDSMQEQKKKDTIPVRIAGDVDGKIHEEPLTSQVGVWRPVGASKPQKTFSSFGSENVRTSIHIKSEDEKSLSNTQKHITTGNNNENAGAPYSKMEETTVAGKSKQPLHELLDAMPMLVQQATSFSDICFDGDCGDGPFGWLAVQEQQRRRFSCGPAMVHAGCGGSLSACHSLDASGVELIDPLFSDVTPAAVANLLYSDVRMALKSAFGDSNLDGPLLLIEWCKGRANTGEGGHSVEAHSGEGGPNDSKESASTVTAVAGEPITPPQCSAISSVSFKGQNIQQSDIQMCEVQRGNKSWSVDNFSVSESTRIDDAGHKRVPQDLETESRNKPTLLGLPVPSLLVGYQDDWLKTSSATLQLWEKAPFEPYARPKPVSYCVVCPNIDPLLSASVDFLLQLGSVYESCKLGTHTSMNTGGFTSLSSGRWASSGIVPFECTQLQKKVQNLSFISSINEYLVAIENCVEVYDFCKSLSETLRNLPIFGNVPGQHKEVESGSSLVIYVICPFMEPSAVLQTVIAACSSVGVARSSSDKGKNQMNYNYIERMQDFASASDETLSVPTLFGFNIPKLVLQVLTADMILRITRPPVTELVLLKEVAFTVYNKVRRIPRANYNHEMVQATSSFPKPRPGNMHMGPAVSGRWKDCNTTRVNSGTLPLSRDTLIDGGCLRPTSWDNSWQAAKHGESILCESSIHGELPFVEDVRYLFEPLFILAEPGTLDQGISLVTTSSLESMKSAPDDISGSNQSSSSSILGETGGNNATEASESDFGGRNQKVANLHCCYGWTEDWQWLVCVWTDARGELLDVHIFPFGGISGRQDTKGLESLFVQVLQQGCQLLSLNPEIGASKLRSIVIAKIGCFYELECQEWQKAILAVGGHEVKKWPMQMRHFSPDGTSSSAGGGTLQQQDIGLIQDRTLPSSPSPIYSTHSKASAFMKGSVGQVNARKQSLSVNSQDGPKGAFQGVHSISLVALCMDHSLQLICPSEIIPLGGSQGTSLGLSSFIEGLNSVKSLASTSVTNLLVPSHGLRFLPPAPLQLPICLTAESPPLAHLLHSKGYAAPLATSFAVSKATPSLRKNSTQQGMGAEWPSTLMVSLIDYYGASTILPSGQQSSVASEPMIKGKHTRASVSEGKEYQADCNSILEALAVEIHALSWLTVSPSFLERRTALPLHCDMVQRLQRLIYFAQKEFYSTNSLKRVLP